ncbi:MAG: CAP domain-containing protein [Cytophagaceae bacterium]|nr:CAP domain-containing protein [Cytophagaceae bacterium]
MRILKRTFLFVLPLLLFGSSVPRSIEVNVYKAPEFIEENPVKNVCVSEEELKLYNLITEYRKQKKLPKIPLSKSLTFVAQTHSKDLMENKPTGECNMHSWSNKGKWTSCCYTPDHKQSQCMWNKPSELTSYKSTGFEISYYYSKDVKAEGALESWKQSKGHNPVIINSGIWKDYKWNAIGIGIYKNYATVWFGTEVDKEEVAVKCK